MKTKKLIIFPQHALNMPSSFHMSLKNTTFAVEFSRSVKQPKDF